MSGGWPDSPHLILHFTFENINKLLWSQLSFLNICVMLIFVEHIPQAEQGKLLREHEAGFQK